MTISDNDFGFCGQGVQLDNAGNVTLQGNTFHGMVDSGIYGNASNVQVIGNTFRENKAAGVTVLSGQNWAFQGNLFDSGSIRQGAGIRLISISGIENTAIQSNVIKDTVYAGIQLYDRGGRIDGVDIGNNTITGTGSSGILIQESSGGMIVNVSVHNNCFASNRSGALRDIRSSGVLSAPLSASSCP